ncbi:MAG: hypothetical protein ACI9QD_000417 [Thermoproteota archaeon]|jgi:hypothetical protein
MLDENGNEISVQWQEEIVTMSRSIKIGLVGAGIAAECFKHYLLQSESFVKNSQIIQFSAPKLAIPTSYTSSSTCTIRGAREAVSELGDRLRNSYFEMEKFYKTFSPTGLTKGRFLHKCPKGSNKVAKFFRRYRVGMQENEEEYFFEDDCYTFSPDDFMSWLKNSSQELAKEKDIVLEHHHELVSSWKKNKNKFSLNLKNNSVIEDFDVIILCTGAFGHMMDLTGNKAAQEKSKLVQGSFLIKNMERPSQLEKFQMIDLQNDVCTAGVVYRKETNEIIIGGSANHWGYSFATDHQQLKDKFALAKSFIPSLGEYCDYRIQTGVRVKGHRRVPYWGEGDIAGLYSVNALYKFGYTLAFLAAKETSKKVLDNITL